MAPPSRLRHVTLASAAESEAEHEEPPRKKLKTMKREATLYDVVAGMFLISRCSLFLRAIKYQIENAASRDISLPHSISLERVHSNTCSGRYTTKSLSLRGHTGPYGSKKLSPLQVLYAKASAPPLYAEDPYDYDAAALLPPPSSKDDGVNDEYKLPDSDVVKAVHTYTSDLYDRHPRLRDCAGKKRGRKDVDDVEVDGVEVNGDGEKTYWDLKRQFKHRIEYRSMDETALLCLGVLMEEMQREALGSTGDLVFTEEGEDRARRRKRKERIRSEVEEVEVVNDDADSGEDLRERKRRRKEEKRARREARRSLMTED